MACSQDPFKHSYTMAGGSGAYRYDKEPKDRNLSLSYVCVGLVTITIALYHLCSTKRVVNYQHF